MLASLGFSARLIESRTGLSNGQVAYRLRMGAIKRQDYRNGDSQLIDQFLLQTGRSLGAIHRAPIAVPRRLQADFHHSRHAGSPPADRYHHRGYLAHRDTTVSCRAIGNSLDHLPKDPAQIHAAGGF